MHIITTSRPLLAPDELWRAWSWEPAVWLGLVGLMAMYTYGVWRLWHGAGPGHGIPHWQAAALFSAHIVHHELLMLIAAPLLILGQPLVGVLWSLPRRCRDGIGKWWGRAARLRAAWHVLTMPLVAWVLHTFALWGWHAPVLYQAALASDSVHILQHLSFLGTALLFWWALIHNRYGRLGYGMAVLYVFATAVHSSVLGALLTFAPSPWYPTYLQSTAAWNLTPLQDQQLAGLIMWVPAGVLYLATGLALFAAWLRAAERRALQRDPRALLQG